MGKHLEQGLIQIYTGNAKGKSTAAFGLALRAAGHGYNIRIVQFMKTGDYGENAAFRRLEPEIQCRSFGKKGFNKKGEAAEEDIALARQAMAQARNWLIDPAVDILILDEINNALWFELVTLAEVEELLQLKPDLTEVVLTGRNAPKKLIERAELVTEMLELKHPYHSGIGSREGIEF
ncbi:cob(I)yrinic acid a,c-diamide adenosyltransferase [Metallumcola ferriviriculae]|uniref:Cob(I)yrinic acid a,c-diamide adenosyltransferase n=1 Tax=Metallumcola ferriviriculae TaxID=3039180 RepID=A0AAU0URV7_9FIRM|nr:cob(I)yrinic acid a,c-diamide adenosyltransferase [Desulfitibacteraceae bacterium MK1]